MKPKFINKWIKVKMTKTGKDGFYTTNLCPACHAESLTQTNACHNCGTIVKGYEAPDCCRTCAYRSCNFKCESCPNKPGLQCRCELASTICPFYEEKA